MAGRNVSQMKPWMLTKNTNEIVTNYVQNIYKQMPVSFNKGLKTCKVATFRPENKGPLSTWKSQQKELPSNSITPRFAVAKKSSSKMKQHTHNVVKFFKDNTNTPQPNSYTSSSNLTANRRAVKTPNYKIYKSLRYGSSCSSSRSSIFKRYDERKRQRQSNLAQINYLVRSFHTSKFEPTYARFLMPARNQQLDTNLGSIPDAIKFSNNMVKDLMPLDKSTIGKISPQTKSIVSMRPSKRQSLDKWNHPPSLSKFKIRTLKEGAIKNVQSRATRSPDGTLLSPEHRDYARLNVGPASPLKPAKPAQELFTPQHDRHGTELQEKHRRNRMKKLGLIKSPRVPEKSMNFKMKMLNGIMPPTEKPHEEPKPKKPQRVPRLGNQTESKILPPLLIQNNTILDESDFQNSSRNKTKTFEKVAAEKRAIKTSILPSKQTLKMFKNSCIPAAAKSNAPPSKYTLPINYTTISPIVALRAQMPNKTDLGSYRFNRHDFFSTNKY